MSQFGTLGLDQCSWAALPPASTSWTRNPVICWRDCATDLRGDHRIAPASSSHQSKSAEPRRPAAGLGRAGATAARLNPSAPADLKTQKCRTGEKWHGIAVA